MPDNYKELVEEQETSSQNTKKTTAHRFSSSVIKFVKKYKLLIAIAITAIIISVLSFAAIPDISIGKTKLVNLGAPVRIEQGQTVRLKTKSVSVIIAHFTNDSCPKSAQCFWSGQAVEYILDVDGQKYATGSMSSANNSGYRIETVSSDYKTYAIIKLNEN